MNSRPRSFLTVVILTILALLTGCSPEAKKIRVLESADRHYNAGDFDRAEVEYLNVLHLEPQNGRAISRLGLIYTEQGRAARAIAYLMRGHELLPEDLDVRLRLAQLYFATGKISDARAEVDYILNHRPADPEAPSLLVAALAKPEEAPLLRQRLLGLPAPAPSGAPVLSALASLELRLGRIDEAEALLQRAKLADASFASLYSMQAAIQLAKKNLPAADEAFKQAATLSPPRSPRQIQYAQFKIRLGEVATGTKLLEDITQKTPDYVPAWVTLAEVNLAQNKIKEAETCLNRALGRDPQNLEALILQGRLHNQKGDFEKAQGVFEKLVSAYPRLPLVYQELGRTYANTGDINKAINTLNQALAIAPNSPEASLLLARLNNRKGDHNAAIALLRKTLEQQPGLTQAQFLLAEAYRNQGNLDGALEIYGSLEKTDANNPQIPLLKGLMLAQLGKYAEARSAFERAFVLSPDSPVALEQLVNLDLREKQFDPAAARIEQEIAKNPKLDGFGQLLLAKIHLAKNEKDQAEARLKRAIELMPDSPTPYFLLAGIYTRTNEQEKALAQLNEVVTRDPKQITALTLISVIHDQRGEFAAARDGYEKILSLNPRSVVALNNLAYLYSEKLGDLDKARELAQKARQFAQNDPHTADTLGWILYKKHEYPWALSLLQEAAERLPSEAEVQFHLGLISYMMGAEGSARTALQRAVEQGAAAAWAADARQALEIINLDPAKISAAEKPVIERALAQRPDDPVALSRQAALYENEGQIEQAIQSLEAAIKASAHNVGALVNLARLHNIAGHSALALEHAKAARKLAPNDPQVALSLARLAYQNRDFPWASSLMQEASRQLPPTPDISFDLALAAYSVGRIAEAETAIRAALDLAARRPGSLFDRAPEARDYLTLIGLVGNPSEAVKQRAFVQSFIKTKPDSVPALMAAGAISEQDRDTGAALQTYEQVLKIFPDFSPAKLRLAVLGATLPNFAQKYLDWALQARGSQPSNSELAKALGILTYRKGDFPRAISLLKEADAGRGLDSESLYYLGLAQLQTKDALNGRQSLVQALQQGLSDDQATAARKRLEELK